MHSLLISLSCLIVTGGAGASRDTTPTPQLTIGSDEDEESILQDTEPMKVVWVTPLQKSHKVYKENVHCLVGF